jgi:hypothetical protein
MTITTKISKIKTGFNKKKDSELSTFVLGIITALTTNVFFPLTQSMLGDLTSNLEDFNTALANAQNRDKVAAEIRNKARITLLMQLIAVAASVTFEAQGDREKLLTSGFELYKEKYTPAPPLPKIENFTLSDGANIGEIKSSVKAVRGAKSYAHQITPDPLTDSSQWHSIITTSRECVFTNLGSSKKYLVRVLAIGTRGQVSYSEILSRTTQ